MSKQIETTDLLYMAENTESMQNDPQITSCLEEIGAAHQKLAVLIADRIGVDVAEPALSADMNGDGSYIGYTSGMTPKRFLAPMPEILKEHDKGCEENSSDWAPSYNAINAWIAKADDIISRHLMPDEFEEESLIDATVLFLQVDGSINTGLISDYNAKNEAFRIATENNPDDPFSVPRNIIVAAMLQKNKNDSPDAADGVTQDFPFGLY